MSAAARAEARRKAILSRGTDRLAKLATSARGEDAAAYIHDGPFFLQRKFNLLTLCYTDPPLPNFSTSDFVGETTDIKPLSASSRSRSTSPFVAASSSNSFGHRVPSSEIFMGIRDDHTRLSPQPPFFSTTPSINNKSIPTDVDPFALLLSSFTQSHDGVNDPGIAPADPTPPTRFQKILPLIHLVAVWCLLAYFVLWKTTSYWFDDPNGVTSSERRWGRWAELCCSNIGAARFGTDYTVRFVLRPMLQG
jgi:GET complex subunit GET2